MDNFCYTLLLSLFLLLKEKRQRERRRSKQANSSHCPHCKQRQKWPLRCGWCRTTGLSGQSVFSLPFTVRRFDIASVWIFLRFESMKVIKHKQKFDLFFFCLTRKQCLLFYKPRYNSSEASIIYSIINISKQLLLCIYNTFYSSWLLLLLQTRKSAAWKSLPLHTGRQLEAKVSQKKSLRLCGWQIRAVVVCKRLKCQHKRPPNATSYGAACGIQRRSCRAARSIEGPGFRCIGVYRQKKRYGDLEPRGK